MRFDQALFVIYLVAIHAVVAVALIKTDLLRRTVVRLGFARRTDPETDRFIERVRKSHREMDPSVPAGATIFLGDGIMMALATAAVTPNGVNYGIGAQHSDHLIASMDAYKSIERAERVVVMVGTVDLLLGRESGIEARYKAILAKIPAHVAVVLSSVAPIAGALVEDSRVRLAVTSAENACKADGRCRFVNVYDGLSSNGTPLPGVLADGGVHLTPEGYDVWIGLLRKTIGPGDAARTTAGL